MRNQFNVVIERDGEWFVGYCLELPGANGQGRTLQICRDNLRASIAFMLEDRREEALRGIPADAIRETIEIP